MANYDFKNLSPYDFELLVRDLLQKQRKIELESFAPGRDEGIDLRYAPSKDQELIVQCKHYASSGYSKLLSNLKKEVPKVRALKPKSYVIATSVSLTPQRKKAIMQLFRPHCLAPRDVLGRESLNNLLTRYKTIERDHFKLWLASATVLNRLIHAKLYSEGAATKETIKRRIARYVVNPSVNDAHTILEREHYCIVVGAAGIGKTTLAEILLARYIDKGYQVFRLWEDVGEARAVLDPNEKQIFYYDDFLGKTGLDHKLKKNEDERLIQFMNEVNRFPRTRFLMATRDYILSQGRSVYDALTSPIVNEAKCVVNLGSYTPFIRAHILYNHLNFSNLPSDCIEAVCQDRNYLSISGHKNYNPRIIQALTDPSNVKGLDGPAYVKEFMASLKDPQRVWKTAYEKHLSPASRDMLLCLTLLPSQVNVDDLKKVFNSFRAHRASLYGIVRDPYDYRNAMDEIDGSLVATHSWEGAITCDFMNPSIQDFMEAHLKRNPTDLQELLMCAPYAHQLMKAARIFQSWDPTERVQAWMWTLNAVSRQFPTPRQCSLTFYRAPVKALDLYSLAIPDEAYDVPNDFRPSVLQLAEDFRKNMTDKPHSRIDLVRVVDATADKSGEHWFPYTRVRDTALSEVIGDIATASLRIEDYQALDELLLSHSTLVAESDRTSVLSTFETFMEQELDGLRQNPDDPESVINALDELETVARSFELAVPRVADQLREEANSQIPSESSTDKVKGDLNVSTEDSEAAIDALFDTLSHKP